MLNAMVFCSVQVCQKWRCCHNWEGILIGMQAKKIELCDFEDEMTGCILVKSTNKTSRELRIIPQKIFMWNIIIKFLLN